jgi:5-methyltetrahydropteroyltriglutamate--homocysteine methyltransferase
VSFRGEMGRVVADSILDNEPRAEVVGSLLRPDYLKDAVAHQQAGELDDAGLRAAQDRAVRERVALQEECGIEVVTDGEMRRTTWSDPLITGLAGFGRSEQTGLFSDVGWGRSMLPAVTGPVALKSNLALAEASSAAACATRPVKVTLPSPSYALALYVPGVSEQAYGTSEEFMAALLPLMGELIREVVEAGFDYIQLDCPRYSTLVMAATRERMRGQGIDPGRRLEAMIGYDNQLIDAFPAVTWGMHVCRGNHRSAWYAEGGYDPIAEQLFSELHVERLFLEYDTPRAGTFEPLRFVAPAKTVVLGLLTTKDPELEPHDLVVRRIEEASRYVPLERLALSPQCGFASTFPGNLLDEGAQRRKLEAVARVAQSVWR